jgi:hypothetical protein
MASRSAARATDPVVGKGILTNAVIKLGAVRPDRTTARTKELNRIGQGRDMSTGYIALMRDTTLAGKSMSRSFRIEDDDDIDLSSASRLRMVRRLRKKENWLMWKYLFHDINRAVASFFTRLAPAQMLKPRGNNLNYEEELAKYLRRVEQQQDAPPLSCVR